MRDGCLGREEKPRLAFESIQQREVQFPTLRLLKVLADGSVPQRSRFEVRVRLSPHEAHALMAELSHQVCERLLCLRSRYSADWIALLV